MHYNEFFFNNYPTTERKQQEKNKHKSEYCYLENCKTNISGLLLYFSIIFLSSMNKND